MVGEYDFYLDGGSGGRVLVPARFTLLFTRDNAGACTLSARGNARGGLRGSVDSFAEVCVAPTGCVYEGLLA